MLRHGDVDAIAADLATKGYRSSRDDELLATLKCP